MVEWTRDLRSAREHPARWIAIKDTNMKSKWVLCCLTALALVPTLVGVGSMAGCEGQKNQAEKPVPIDAERYRVELFPDDHALGGDNPLVTIVLFSDYACGPCGGSWQVMDHLHEHYGDDLRIVWRSFTVPGFKRGDIAAEAALAAGGQGKFWEMHRRLFKDTDGFSRTSLRAHAESIGLDTVKFIDDLDSGVYSGPRVRHRRQAQTLGIQALPIGFVNGLFLMGGPLLDEDGLRSLIDAEMARARALIQEGTPRPEVYEKLQEGAVLEPVLENEAAKELREKRKQQLADDAKPTGLAAPEGGKRYDVPVGAVGHMGPEDAAVVVVEFTDFQCPFCRKAHTEVMSKLREKYGDQVRFEIRHLPLDMHPAAPGAAKASLAAAEQGKFWEFHDGLFGLETVGYQSFLKLAEQLELDVERFKRDFNDPRLDVAVKKDVTLAYELGVMGTPGFFVNGRYIDGVRSLATYEDLIEEDLEKAKTLAAAGKTPTEVRNEIMTGAVAREAFPNRAVVAAQDTNREDNGAE